MKIKLILYITCRYYEENNFKAWSDPFISKCFVLEMTHGEHTH